MDNSIFTDIVALYMAAGPRVDNPALVALLSVIPGWLLFVQVEKYRQGVPLLEGPIWQRPGKSPRTIDTAPTKTTGFDGHSQVERGLAHFATPYPEPSHVPSLLEHFDTVLSADSSSFARNSRPLSAGPLGISGLVVYQQPLGVHDSSTVLVTWVCALFVGCAFVMFSFCITAKGRACLAGGVLKKKVEEPKKAKTSNWTLSGIESVGTFPSAQQLLPSTFLAPTQITEYLEKIREARELQKVIELMDGNSERQQTRFAKLQQQNRGLRWGKDQQAKKLVAADTRARNLQLRSADHTNHEPAQAKNDPGDYAQEDRKSEEDCHGYAHLETPEEGRKGRQYEKAIDQKDDSDSDDLDETLDLSMFFKILQRKQRRRGNRKSKAVHAEDAAPPDDPVGGDLTNEPPSFPPFHDLPCEEAQGTAVDEGASTDSTAALTPCTTSNRTHADIVQGRRDDSGEVKEDVIRKDTTTSTVETHDDNGKEGGNEHGDEDVEEGGKGEGRKDRQGGREVKADTTASKKRGDCNDDSEKKGRQAEEDGKENAEKRSNGDIDENVLNDGDDVPENDGLDGASAVGEGKPKKKRIRQNKKRRTAKRAAAAAANEEIGESPDAFGDDTKVEPEAHHPPETGPGGAPQANTKGKGSKERKQEVKDHAVNDLDHEPDHLAEDSQSSLSS
ncbi:MAG: hypothetical protein ASARMPREDX12_006816 [Alectoria sarmentosa]|nr:MAG: hypothetical protein ASARMPREDX12_006816 [Alectoria sarmentosa]